MGLKRKRSICMSSPRTPSHSDEDTPMFSPQQQTAHAIFSLSSLEDNAEISTPDLAENISGAIEIIPRHLDCRTRKRWRTNRPSDEVMFS
jgi:hypothetical protein